jgi:integrase
VSRAVFFCSPPKPTILFERLFLPRAEGTQTAVVAGTWQQLEKETKQTTEGKAMKNRGVFERTPGSGKWSIRYADASGRIRWEKAGSKSAAILLYRKRKNEVLQGKKLPETLRRRAILFSEIAESALEYSRWNKRSYRDDVTRMKRLKDWFGNREAESLGAEEMEARLCEAASTGKWAASTFNHYRTLLMLVFREARRGGKVSVNPARDLRHRREDNSRVRFLTDEEDKRLRDIVCSEYAWHLPELEIAVHTGLRRGSQYGLTWDMVDWQGRMLNVARTKNEEPVHIPLNDIALSVLRTVRARGVEEGRIFRSERTGEPLENGRHWFEPAIRDAKIVDFHWHDLRHTFASRLRVKGVSLETIADLLGHKGLTMTKRYAHIGPSQLTMRSRG